MWKKMEIKRNDNEIDLDWIPEKKDEKNVDSAIVDSRGKILYLRYS